MIVLGKGVCGDESVFVNQPYLARIDEYYFVVMPIDPNSSRLTIPLKEAFYYDDKTNELRPFTDLHELAPIY